MIGKIKKYMKNFLAYMLMVTLCLQSFTGFNVNVKAEDSGAESESTYTELKFGDWGNKQTVEVEGQKYDVYKLDSSKITSLEKVAVSGKVNFNNSEKVLSIGGTDNAKHAGFGLRSYATGSNHWQILCNGIESQRAQDIWSTNVVNDKEFELRITFDKETGTDKWTVKVYADNVKIYTVATDAQEDAKSGDFLFEGAKPGLYLSVQEGILVNMDEKSETIDEDDSNDDTYKEIKFTDWEYVRTEGDVVDMYALPNDKAISSLDGVAVSGMVNFNSTPWNFVSIGGISSSIEYNGELKGINLLMFNAGNLGIRKPNSSDAQSFENDKSRIDTPLYLRMTFDYNKSNDSWDINTYVDGVLLGKKTYEGITLGTCMAIYKTITIYDEMSFEDWGVADGAKYGVDTYSLSEPDKVDSLDKKVVTGTVNYKGNNNSYFRIGGLDYENRHAGFQLGHIYHSSGNGFGMVAQGVTGANGNINIMMDTAEWNKINNQDIELSMVFDKNADGDYYISVFVNGKRYGTYNCGTAQLGLYMANSGVSIEGLGGPDIYNSPTEMGGKTLSGTYITNVSKQNDTTVISSADTDNNYATKTDYKNYGLDFVMDYDVDRDIKVLQLTDTQIIDSAQCRTTNRIDAGSKAVWATEQMYNNLFRYILKTVRDAKPDLILITGDVIYGEFDDDGTALTALIKCMDSLKIPWAPIFGNHDNESEMGVKWQCEQFVNSPYCIFNRRNEIGGNGNYSIGISKKGKLQRVIYMLDSNGCYNSNELNGVEVISRKDGKAAFGFTEEQKNWYKTTAQGINALLEKTIPSFLCYHVPTKDVAEAVVAAGYQEDVDSKATYTLGVDIPEDKVQSGDSGTKGANWNIYSYEQPGLLELMKSVGTDGAFFGHEHLNSISVKYEGIRWTYGLKTGTYDSSPTVVGGTLITLDSSSNDFTVKQVQVDTKTIGDVYPYLLYTGQKATTNPNYIYVNLTENPDGYKVTNDNVKIGTETVANGSYYKKTGTPMITYTEDGTEIRKRLIVYAQGDADVNGEIDIRDLVRGKKYVLKSVVADEAAKKATDLNSDDKISEDDITLLRQTIAKKKGLVHYGLGEPVNDLDVGEVDYASGEFVSQVVGAYGADTFRVWAPNLGKAVPNNDGSYNVTLDGLKIEKFQNLIDRLRANGVKQIVMMTSPLIPSDFPNFIGTDGKSYTRIQLENNEIPCDIIRMDGSVWPERNTKEYKKFLEVQEEYFKLISETLPDITHFEGINEPEHEGATLHKVGWLTDSEAKKLDTSVKYSGKQNYEFSIEECAKISMDYNYAITKGVKDGKKGAAVLAPALTGLEKAKNFLEEAYKYIEDDNNYYADNDTDNYFTILNWHPYVFESAYEGDGLLSSQWEKSNWENGWVNLQKSIYQIAVDHGDSEKYVWFTEFGVTDRGSSDDNKSYPIYGSITEKMTAERIQDMYDIVKERLPFVNTVIAFRLFDKSEDTSGIDEANFGMFEEFENVESANEAWKPIGKTLFNIMKGQNASEEKLLSIVEKYFKINKGTYEFKRSEDFENATVKNNIFTSNSSDITVSYDSGYDYLLEPSMAIIDYEGSKALAVDYSEGASLKDIPKGYLSFGFGKVEPGTYIVKYNIDGVGLDDVGYWGTTYLGISDIDEPRFWLDGVISNTLSNDGIICHKNNNYKPSNKNEFTFTVDETKNNLYLTFQINGKYSGDETNGYSANGKFRVIFDNISMTKLD